MTREQIEIHPAWKYISGLSNSQRYSALTGSSASALEKAFAVKIEEWSFTRLSEIPDNWMSISATDSFRNMAMIMVLRPDSKL